jgi:hypothetical protein
MAMLAEIEFEDFLNTLFIFYNENGGRHERLSKGGCQRSYDGFMKFS